ncbi:glucagon family neuropeptides-like isoform X1 [Labeo rohita]|uniref:Glucagon family neuropeptides-like isoform X1 n=1 Tax=Labeo rohita TaxID=84645 RepID=A0A498MYA9_LABRO|nr:glucagon family neuropeptides-like isoform X1 [Labeo rohita]RXN21635.1 glucagon family neuropeptides-like isoform X1 [Labeo rohita]
MTANGTFAAFPGKSTVQYPSAGQRSARDPVTNVAFLNMSLFVVVSTLYCPTSAQSDRAMARSSKATLALLIYGIMMHYSAYCTPIGMTFPKMRLDNDVFDEDGNSLSDLAFGTDQIAIRSPPSLTDDLYTLYYPPEKRKYSVAKPREFDGYRARIKQGGTGEN